MNKQEFLNASPSRKNAVKKNLILQYVSLGLGMIKGFFIIPIYFIFIDSELYGYWLATGSLLVWINIIDPGAGTVLQQKVAYDYGNKNKNGLQFLIGSGLIVGISISIIALIISFLFSYFIPELLNFSNPEFTETLILSFNIAAIGTCFSLITSVIRGVNFGMQKTVYPGIIEIGSSLIGITVNIFMLYNGYGLYSIAWMLLVSGVLTSIGNLVYLRITIIRENINIKYSFEKIKPLFKEFSYTFFSRLSNTLSSNIDLILIARFLNAETVTMIEMTRRPFKIMSGIVYKPSVALSPAISHLSGEKDMIKIKSILFKFIQYSIWSYGFILAGFLIFNKSLISLWIGEDKFAGVYLSLIILVGITLKGFFSSIGNINFALGNIKGTSVIMVIQNILYIILAIVLGKYFSITGIMMAIIPSVLLTIGWYYFKNLFNKSLLSKNSLIAILTSLLVVSIICIMAFYLEPYLSILSWYQLVYFGIFFSFIFLTILYISSKSFRLEIIVIKNKFIKKINI